MSENQGQLTVEQLLRLENYRREIQNLPAQQLRELLIQAVTASMIKDNLVREYLKNH